MSLFLLSTLSVLAYDSGIESLTNFSEFDYYLQTKDLTSEELIQLGYSQTDAKYISSFNLENELLKRSRLSYETLKAYGYNDYQIKLLKAYDGSEITEKSEIMAVSSRMSGYFHAGTCNNQSMAIRYSWSWDIYPILKMTDITVLSWKAIDSSGMKIDVTGSSYSALVKYYNINNASYAYGRSISGTFSGIKDCVSHNIEMTDDDVLYWAKKGTTYITLTPGGNSSFNYIHLSFTYGHATTLANPSFSISSNLIVTFSPALAVETEIEDFAIMYSSGQIE